MVLPVEFLRQPHISGTLADVDRTLISALDSAGYFDKSYYAVPDGFAVVTHLEQIEADGTSKVLPDRWALTVRPSKFSLRDYLRALFTTKPGFYRVIVFIVSSQPFSETQTEINRSEAMAWLFSGFNRLPAELGRQEFSEDHRCTALIYEFEQPGGGASVRLAVPSEVQGRTHLEKANLWDAFSK